MPSAAPTNPPSRGCMRCGSGTVLDEETNTCVPSYRACMDECMGPGGDDDALRRGGELFNCRDRGWESVCDTSSD